MSQHPRGRDPQTRSTCGFEVPTVADHRPTLLRKKNTRATENQAAVGAHFPPLHGDDRDPPLPGPTGGRLRPCPTPGPGPWSRWWARMLLGPRHSALPRRPQRESPHWRAHSTACGPLLPDEGPPVTRGQRCVVRLPATSVAPWSHDFHQPVAALPQKGVLWQVPGEGPVLPVSGNRGAPLHQHRVLWPEPDLAAQPAGVQPELTAWGGRRGGGARVLGAVAPHLGFRTTCDGAGFLTNAPVPESSLPLPEPRRQHQ